MESIATTALSAMRADEPAHDFPDEDKPYEPGIGMIGHAGPYFPFDPEDPRAPVKEKRSPGFVTADDYVVKVGDKHVVRQYKRKRKR